MSHPAPDFTTLLAEGSRHDVGHLREGWTATVRAVHGADLRLPDGRVVACEPSVHVEVEPFVDAVEPGVHRVELIVADIMDATGAAVETTNAAARMVVRDEPVVSWRAAVPEGQDAPYDGEAWTYPVDGGLGCFASLGALVAYADGNEAAEPPGRTRSTRGAEALDRIEAELRDDDGTMDRGRARGLTMLLQVSRDLDRLNPPEDSAEVGVWTDRASGANIVSFRTGGGDGNYATWVGYTAAGEVACFLTDFQLVEDD